MYTIYVLKCGDDTLYTGITNNIKQRIKQHNLGKGAKYTKGRNPVKLVYQENASDKSTALKREFEIKKMTRAQKQKLISDQNEI